ncbi:MAG TPA: ABC transporter permease [Actinobacteria bacterium]|nr:ABC transporter permease [Actinomycetota bacterium]
MRRVLLALLAPVAALVFSLAVAAVALALVGRSPLEAFAAMWDFARTSTSVASMINRAVPLYISAVAVAVGFQMGLFNIGVEGQYLLAALFAGWVGGNIVLAAPLHVAVIIAVAVVVGMAWAGIAGALKVTRGVHEVISTIMLNFIAFSLIAYLLLNHFRDDPDRLNLQTPALPESGRIPSLNWLFSALGFSEPRGIDLHGFALFAIVVGVFYYLLVWRTRFGFELRSSGLNPGAARMAGVEPNRMIMNTMFLSGGIAGLVGLSTIFGNLQAYTQDFPRFLGFNGIAVALLGRNHPVGMALGALLFGFMERSALILDLEETPKEVVTIMQGVVVLAVVVAYEVVTRIIERYEIRRAAEATRASGEEVGG